MTSVRLLPIDSAPCAAKVWKTGGKTFATIVVKATFAPLAGGALALVPDGDPIVVQDEHWEQNPTKSLREASDLAPYLPRGEVLVHGVAHSTGGARGVVRIVVARGQTPLVDRRVVVRGDDAPRGQALVVALTYENAFGGPGQKQNPVGRATPLLVDPKDGAAPGSLGPIARVWQARSGLLDATQKKGVVGKVWNVDGVPPDYFHAAPPSQRASTFFAGDETIHVDGVTPNGARIDWRLPGARAEARVLGADGASTPVRMSADLLRVDTERRRVSLVFRGYFAVDTADARTVVATGVALPGASIAWPDVIPAEPESTRPESARAESARGMGETAVVHLEGLSAPTLPFGATRETEEPKPAESRPIPGAPWSAGNAPPSSPPPQASPVQRQTFELPRADRAAATAPPVAPPPVAPPPVVAPPAPFLPPAAPAVVPVTPVAGSMQAASVLLPPGLGSELLFALRDELVPARKEGR